MAKYAALSMSYSMKPDITLLVWTGCLMIAFGGLPSRVSHTVTEQVHLHSLPRQMQHKQIEMSNLMHYAQIRSTANLDTLA